MDRTAQEKNNIYILIPTLLFISAALFFGARIYFTYAGMQEFLALHLHVMSDYFDRSYFSAIQGKLIFFGSIFLILGILMLIFQRKQKFFLNEVLLSNLRVISRVRKTLQDYYSELCPFSRWSFWIILAVGVLLRVIFINQPMRFDEAYSYQHFISKPFLLALSNYIAPNNHVFYTLLAKLGTGFFGTSPFVLRLPAFIFGVFMIPLVYFFTRYFSNRWSALLAMALVSVSSVMVLYSTNARGYTMLSFLVLLVILSVEEIIRNNSYTGWISFIVLSVLGAYSIPIMLLPFSGLILYLFYNSVSLEGSARRKMFLNIVLSLLSTGILVIIIYAPIICYSGIKSIVANKFLTADYWDITTAGVFLVKLWDSWTSGIPTIMKPVFFVMLIVGILQTGGNAVLRRITGFLSISAVFFISISGSLGPARIWLFIFPLVLMLIANGAEYSVRFIGRIIPSLPGRGKRLMYTLIVILLLLLNGSTVLSTQSPIRSNETGVFPQAQEIANFLIENMRPGDLVLNSHVTEAPLFYYLKRAGNSGENLFQAPDSAERFWLVQIKNRNIDIPFILKLNGLIKVRAEEGVSTGEFEGAELFLFEGCELNPVSEGNK